MDVPPKGTGNVLLSIKPKTNLASGTTIRNKATIQFEIFAPLTTNEIVNIIDTTVPVCKVNSLPPQTASTTFSLSWTRTDAVGEVDTVSVFVAVNNGTFVPLLRNTKRENTMYAGQIGSKFSFYCTATDTVGNAEIDVPIAEASTTIIAATLPGDVNGDGVVDCRDIATVKAALGKKAGQPGWDPRADIVTDGIIDVRDLAYVSQRLPVGTRCQ